LPTLPVPSAAPLADAASPAGPVVTPAEAGAAPVPPLASAEVPPASPAPSAEPAGTASRRVVPVRPLLRGLGVSTLVVAALFGGSVAALAADASGSAAPTPAVSGSASGGPGVLWFDYAKGHDDDPVNVATSGLCPSQDDWVSAAISGPGFPASGASALGLSAAKIYSPSSTGGFVVPLDQTLRAIARQNGVPQLHGAYRVDVFCRGRFNPAHLRDFYGTLTFGAGEAWAADRATAIALPQSMEPPASAMPKPKPQPVAAPAASTGDGISPVSIVTMAAGAVLLLALGGQALRRRRAEVVAAKTDAKNETKPQAEKTKAAQR
jgi:hypothetical protein